jgi:hypothetical protein
MLRSIVFLLCIISLSSQAQNNTQPPPCSSPEASQFDFWLGDWTATWSDTLHGTNHIEKIMGGCTVQENFTDPNINYLGKSWTVYNANYKIWQQTWVDNQGGYIALTGGKAGDSMILTTAERNVPVTISATGKLTSRMVFYNIKQDSFNWNWEASSDGGKTWKLNWHIQYRRKAGE